MKEYYMTSTPSGSRGKKKKKKKKRNKTAKIILELIQNSQFFYITREIPYCQHLSFFDFVEYLTIYGMV